MRFSDIHRELVEIVGEEFVSLYQEEKFIYSRDPSVQPAHEPDFVVMPKTTEQVQKIVVLANKEKIPLVPLGGGLALSGISIPQRGGIVLDMKRMNRIIEINEISRYAVVEAGVTTGMLEFYLRKHHPSLRFSLPDAPPSVTIVGNVMIHGSGHLSQSEGGFHSDMVTGMEVVLPTGDIVKLGSCSTVPGWFSRAPLPDLCGLFLGWNGTTGIVTKLGIKLFPRHRFKDVFLFMTEREDAIPDIMWRLVQTEMVEDLKFFVTPKPVVFEGFQITIISIVAHTLGELKLKKQIIRDALRDYWIRKEAGFYPMPALMKRTFMDAPQKNLTSFADVRKGGGFEYVGAIIPVERIPEAYRIGMTLPKKYRITYSLGGRMIGRGHSFMFYYAYPFNRVDEDEIKRVRDAIEETNIEVLKIGGIPWKAEIGGQRLILGYMDETTRQLMKRIKNLLDPNKIMNPGNWEV